MVRTDPAQKNRNKAIKIQARMPITTIALCASLNMHKGDKVDLNKGDARVPQKHGASVSLLCDLPLFLVATNNIKNGRDRRKSSVQ